jgi:hypothetical protein
MEGTTLTKVLEGVTLESMTNGTMSELWAELPEMVSGQAWVGEIVDCADTMRDYISNDEQISEDRLSDLGLEFANSEVEDYYNNINKRVQALSLWARGELDEEVLELTGGQPQTLTDLNSLYLWSAMRGLWDAVSRWALAQAEQLEEVSA